MSSGSIDLGQIPSGAVTGGVSDVNALTGSITLAAGTGISLTPAGNTITIASTGAGSGTVTSVSASLPLSVSNSTTTPALTIALADTSTDGYLSSSDWNTFNGKQDPISGSYNSLAYFDGTGVIASVPGTSIDTSSGGISQGLTEEPDGVVGGFSVNSIQTNFAPLQNSPDESWTVLNVQANLDTNNDGFSFGTNGEAVALLNLGFSHFSSGDVGGLAFIKNYFNLGNSVDPINVNGVAYSYGFGNINDGVTVSGSIQGYGFQPYVSAGATMGGGSYINAFYDYANIYTPANSYTSYGAGPQIAEITNNHNYQGVTLNATIPTFSGNAGYTGLGIYPILGTFDTGGFTGISINPSVNSVRSATGIDVNMDNVTVFSGAKASLTVQDLFFEANAVGSDANNASIEYTSGGTAGAEVVTQLGYAFSVQIQSGVSTATQIKAALDGFFSFTTVASVIISGVGSNPQVVAAAANFAGGLDPGSKKAANFSGDVNINGALAFTGALSVGQINAFASHALTSGPGPGSVASIDLLVTGPTVAANDTVVNADLIGVNTAMLLNVGDNATVTTAFLGISALGLPAVVTLGVGATVDHVAGATFAISLDGTATGGTIDVVDLCNTVAIPNGVTAINKLRGYAFDLPFGDPGTQSWGLYLKPAVNNWIAGSLKLGGTAGFTDVVTNSSVALEIESTTSAFLLSRMDTAARDALTAINGMLIYNTSTNKFQGYENGAWVNLI